MPSNFLKSQRNTFGLAESKGPYPKKSLSELDVIVRLVADNPVASLRIVDDGYLLEPVGKGFKIELMPTGPEVNAVFASWRGALDWPACLDYVELALAGRLRVRSESFKDQSWKKSTLEVRPIDEDWRETKCVTFLRLGIPRKLSRTVYFSYPERSLASQ